MENPYALFYYGKYLVNEYPEQVYGLVRFFDLQDSGGKHAAIIYTVKEPKK